MEQIIILIVIGLLSTLFNKKNKSGDENQQREIPKEIEPTQSRPITETRQATSSEQMDPFKRLKELTGEIYKEIQVDPPKPVAEQPVRNEPISISEVPGVSPVDARPVRTQSRANTRSSGRLSTHNSEQQRFVKRESLNVDVTSKQDILKGIVFSEILGPPKSKQ